MTTELTVLIGPIPGGPELIVILLIAVLLFGANKIPKLARSTGQAMGEFQRGREEIEQELDEIKEGPSSSSEDDTLGSTDDTLGSTDDTATGSDLGSEAETSEESS